MADSYQALTNWACFAAVAGAAIWYYLPTEKKPQKPAAVKEALKEVKKDTKKPNRKDTYAQKAAQPAAENSSRPIDSQSQQNGNKKRKANTQPAGQSTPAPAAAQPAEDEIDMSTRQFAEQMRKAQQGVSVKQAGNNESRVRTVKAKSSQINSPVLSSGSSQDDGDEWAPAASSAARSTGIDDMLEPVTPGPNSLRITAAQAPAKERVNKAKKEEVVETKKQRQNRKKREARQAEQQEAQQSQKALAEQQRRTARIARGEPAKNGINIPSAPVTNPWSEPNAAREAQLPAVVSSGGHSQLLDTFDVDSNSSSNAENSTAATSIADHPPAENAAPVEEAAADSGWTTQTSKKAKKKGGNGDATPVQQSTTVNGTKPKAAGKPSGFQALQDEYVERADTDSAWTA